MKIDTEGISITIEYLLEKENFFHRIRLRPEEYWDEDFIDDNCHEFADTIPLYEDAIHYIKHSHQERVVYTILHIIDHKKNVEEICSQFYWKKQNCDLTQTLQRSSDQNNFFMRFVSKNFETTEFVHVERHENEYLFLEISLMSNLDEKILGGCTQRASLTNNRVVVEEPSSVQNDANDD